MGVAVTGRGVAATELALCKLEEEHLLFGDFGSQEHAEPETLHTKNI